MRAVIAQDQKPVVVELPQPVPQAHEILVRVHATALNRADLLQVQGKYPPPAGSPETLGMELAGEVIQVGASVTKFKVGARVMALVGGGGYADYATLHAEHAMFIPEGMSYTEAAAIPEAFLTAYSNMVEIGGLVASDTVLIHAAASGVGLAAIQLAKVIGATVIGTASAGKHAVCFQAGADRMIDYQTENFADVLEQTPPDLILDMIGANYWADNVRVLKPWGRMVIIGLMGGAQTQVDWGVVMRKCLTVSGSTLRHRSDERKASLVGRFEKWALPLFRTGQLKPTVWKILPLEEVTQAHQLLQTNQSAGKIILTLT